jgi:alkylation response protein AidB-like acyl-CoA dehydrogenase
MLDFEFSEEQQLFRATVREFVDRELTKEHCTEVEASTEFPFAMWDQLARAGFTGVGVGAEHGGQGGGIVEQVILDEELSRSMAGLYWMLGIALFDCKAIAAFGTDDQKARFLAPTAVGDMRWAISLTEPDGGTDVFGAMKTRATRVDGGWVVDGSKIWSTMAHVADRLFLVARTGGGKRSHEGVTVFLCDARADGITATPIPKLGMRALGSCEVVLDEVFIPDEDTLGEVDKGWMVLAETLNSERIMNGANCSGALAGVLELMVAYVGERSAFGKPIGQMQAVQHMIADTYAGLETSRLHTYRAAWLQSLGKPCGVESTMAKLIASEECFAGADRGMQVMGGYGYATEYDMQRYWRDMRLYRVAPINNEMGRNFLAESLGLPRSF